MWWFVCVLVPRADRSFSPFPASGSQLETYPVALEDHYPHPSLGSFVCLMHRQTDTDTRRHRHRHTHTWFHLQRQSCCLTRGPSLGPGGGTLPRLNDSLQESTCRMMTVPMPGSWTISSQWPFNLQIKQIKSHYVEYLQETQRFYFIAVKRKKNTWHRVRDMIFSCSDSTTVLTFRL